MEKTSPLISIVIPSRANSLDLLDELFWCFEKQTIKDFEVVVVCDRDFEKKEWEDFLNYFSGLFFPCRFLSHFNSSFVPHSKWGASYVRNFWIDNAKWEYIQLLDDDNQIDEDYLEKVLKYHKEYLKIYKTEVFITPTLLWRNTTTIQNQWFEWYNYWQARPMIHFLSEGKECWEIKMFSGNWIFWKADIMRKVRYDEEIAWIAEDLDFVYSIREKGYPILVFRDLVVHHQERDKTLLEQAWIWNKKSAQQKIRNIFLWTKKHADICEKLIVLLWSSWWICWWLSIKACLYWWDKKIEIVEGLWSWYFQWWKSFLGK